MTPPMERKVTLRFGEPEKWSDYFGPASCAIIMLLALLWHSTMLFLFGLAIYVVYTCQGASITTTWTGGTPVLKQRRRSR